MSTAEKAISYCSQRGYLHYRAAFLRRASWQKQPEVKGVMSPLGWCTEPWQCTCQGLFAINQCLQQSGGSIQGCRNNNDHVIKDTLGSFSLYTHCEQWCVNSECLFLMCVLVRARERERGGVREVRTTSSSDSSRPWMLLLSRTACWCLLPLVWLNRCTSEVIYKHKHNAQRSLQWTQRRQRKKRVQKGPRGCLWYNTPQGLIKGTELVYSEHHL